MTGNERNKKKIIYKLSRRKERERMNVRTMAIKLFIDRGNKMKPDKLCLELVIFFSCVICSCFFF